MNVKKNLFLKNISDLQNSLEKLKKYEPIFLKAAMLINKTLKKNKVIFCGNGGSAADASHVVAEFVGRYLKKKRKSLNAISLNENIASLTAIANDFGYNQVFSRQLEGVANKGDVLFAISTSSKSKNIIEAIKKAKLLGLKIILLTGDNKIKIKGCDITIKTPAQRVDRIQELHILILHLISEYIDRKN